jgi:hypothetical protein
MKQTDSIAGDLWDIIYRRQVWNIERNRNGIKWGVCPGEVVFKDQKSLIKSFLRWLLTVDSSLLIPSEIKRREEEEYKLRVRYDVVDHGRPMSKNEKLVKDIKASIMKNIMDLSNIDSLNKTPATPPLKTKKQLLTDTDELLFSLVFGRKKDRIFTGDMHRLFNMWKTMNIDIATIEKDAFLDRISQRRIMHPDDNIFLKKEKASTGLTPHPEIPAAMRKSIKNNIESKKMVIEDCTEYNNLKKAKKENEKKEQNKQWFKSINEARKANGHKELSWGEFNKKTQELNQEIMKERTLTRNIFAALPGDTWARLLRSERFVPPKAATQ